MAISEFVGNDIKIGNIGSYTYHEGDLINTPSGPTQWLPELWPRLSENGFVESDIYHVRSFLNDSKFLILEKFHYKFRSVEEGELVKVVLKILTAKLGEMGYIFFYMKAGESISKYVHVE